MSSVSGKNCPVLKHVDKCVLATAKARSPKHECAFLTASALLLVQVVINRTICWWNKCWWYVKPFFDTNHKCDRWI